MLKAIHCDKFRVQKISFSKGLNAVLGDAKATNSIGKSSCLMVIDFAFGGDGLIKHNTDIIKELGEHYYYFQFVFHKQNFYFKRGTYDPNLVYVCDEKHTEVQPISGEEYRGFLQQKYELSFNGLSFRSAVSPFSRIWGKENLDVKRPLHSFTKQTAQEAINNLIKTFETFSSLASITLEKKANVEQRDSLSKAFKHNILTKISKKTFENNIQNIKEREGELDEIKNDLARYSIKIEEIINKESLHLNNERELLIKNKASLEEKLARIRRNIKDTRHIKSKTLKDLEKYFPSVNSERLNQIEIFHSNLTKILGAELKASETEIEQRLVPVTNRLSAVTAELERLVSNHSQPGAVIERALTLATETYETKRQNNYYSTELRLQEAKKDIDRRLHEMRVVILNNISAILNDKMRQLTTSVYNEKRKNPEISFSENNYNFETYEDRGTGKAYSNLIIFDLAIFLTTKIPFLIHDSLIFKNVETTAVANIIAIYASINKQSFIAIDEIDKYGKTSIDTLSHSKVLQLTHDQVLYVKDWRKQT